MATTNPYPDHVLVIPDGNRRYARANNISLEETYKLAASKMGNVAKWILRDTNTSQLTIHGLSYDNVNKRKWYEIEPIVNAITDEFEKWIDYSVVHKKKIKINIYGENETLPKRFQDAKRRIEENTRGYGDKQLNVLIGYSGTREILSLLKRSYSNNIDDTGLLKHLWINTPIDIVIRTSNTYRLSNCPLYQINYAELMFIEKCFPEITKEDIKKVMEEYSLRERRYGK